MTPFSVHVNWQIRGLNGDQALHQQSCPTWPLINGEYDKCRARSPNVPDDLSIPFQDKARNHHSHADDDREDQKEKHGSEGKLSLNGGDNL